MKTITSLLPNPLASSLKRSDFDYVLPAERIAQSPVAPRDHSRLMVLDRKSGAFEHKHFFDITSYLRTGDVLVLNATRVFPARLRGKKKSGGKAEVLLLGPALQTPPFEKGRLGGICIINVLIGCC